MFIDKNGMVLCLGNSVQVKSQERKAYVGARELKGRNIKVKSGKNGAPVIEAHQRNR